MLGLSSRWPVVSVALVSACRIEIEKSSELAGERTDGLRRDERGTLEPDAPYGGEPPCSSWSSTPCTEGGELPEEPPPFVDPYPQLLVLEPQIVRGRQARNDSPSELAPLSFQAQMSWLAGEREPLDFTLSWLAAWSSETSVGPEAAPVTPRPRVTSVLYDGWLAASGVPVASGDAGAPPVAAPSWGAAPFELIAVVNRVDLAADACAGPAGELRYVYAAVDPQTRQVLDATLILEIPYPSTRPAAAWARDWQRIAALPSASRAAALAELALAVRQGADPLRVRLRSNEVALAEPGQRSWELREFQLAVQGSELALLPAALEFTPRADADPALLSEHVLAHADEIRRGAVSLPAALRAGAATTETEDFSWQVLGVSEGLRQAFSRETCNGCHGGDTRALPFRHIAPDPDLRRPAQLSGFLYDPSSEQDDLRRRAIRLEVLAATECEPPPDDPGGYFDL